MTIRFTARAAGVEEDLDETLSAGVAEHPDGGGMALTFMCGLDEPDEQDVEQGMDSYCLVTADQGTAYGGVTEVVLRDGVLRVVVAADDLEALGLDDTEIEAVLDVDEQDVERLRDALRRILAYGRPDAHPAVVRL
ncbi:Imm10 family immunity protein [Spirillospora sp. NPDC050679]